MNERIRELAVEAKLIASEPNGFDQNNLSKAQQKFAELIVQECCDIVHRKTDESIRVVMAIEQHFGVEE